MSEYKLIYFNVRGRGEICRLILAQAGVKFEDKRIEFKDLDKASMPIEDSLPQYNYIVGITTLLLCLAGWWLIPNLHVTARFAQTLLGDTYPYWKWMEQRSAAVLEFVGTSVRNLVSVCKWP